LNRRFVCNRAPLRGGKARSFPGPADAAKIAESGKDVK
jgi:hypothetical protein